MSVEQGALFSDECGGGVGGPVEQWLAERFSEVGPQDFYRELFPAGELERARTKGPGGEWVYEAGKYHGVAIRVFRGKDGLDRAHRYTITDDLTGIEPLLATNDFCVMAPVSFAGRAQSRAMARNLYAVVIDLDDVIVKDGWAWGLGELWYQATKMRQTSARIWAVPVPTFMVASGTGAHLYYLLERPVPLFDNVIEQLRRLRHGLVRVVWNDRVTNLYENRQYEAVTQGFRMVGSVTKTGRRVRAFRTGKRVSIEYLNSHVREDERVTHYTYKSELTLAQAKDRYPEWYQRRVVEGQPRGTWTVKRDLYEWWKRKLLAEAREGHRYFCVMALAVYARKCAISYDELSKDALGFVDVLSKRGEPFTVNDTMKALAAYDDAYITFPRATIERLTGIRIDPNKRNYWPQRAHLRGARALQAINCEMTGRDWRYHGGAPTKGHIVRAWREANPSGRKIECHRETGLSRVTIDKWWG